MSCYCTWIKSLLLICLFLFILFECMYVPGIQKTEKDKSFTSPASKRPPSPSTLPGRHRSPSPGPISGPRRTPSPGATKWEPYISSPLFSYSFLNFRLSRHNFLMPHYYGISTRQSPRYRPPSPSGLKQRPPSPQPASKTPPVPKPALTPTGPPVLRKRESKPKDTSPMTALTSQPQDSSTASTAPSTKPKDGENYLFIHML